MTKIEIESSILNYINQKLFNNKSTVKADTPLYSSGLLNSMAHLKLVSYLERTFDISVPSNAVNLENFDTLDLIVNFVNDRIGK